MFCTASRRSGRVSMAIFPEIVQRLELFLEIGIARDVELVNRRAVVHQHQELNLRRPQIHQRGFEIRFKTAPAAAPARLQIHLRDIAAALNRTCG